MLWVSHPVKVFATRGSDILAAEVCTALQTRLPKQMQPKERIELGAVKVDEFSNENMEVQVENVRGHFVVVIHTQVPPVNRGLVEFFALLDAVINARPADVLVVFPYMPYARSDRKNKPRISTMARRLAHILSHSFGIRRVLLLDPHDSHVKHYFDPAADEIAATFLLMEYLKRGMLEDPFAREATTIVFADPGAATRFERLPHFLGLPVAYIDKERTDNSERPRIKKVIGDVRGRRCIMVDDEMLTGGTVLGDLTLLREEGAAGVSIVAIHAILNDLTNPDSPVAVRLAESDLDRIIITDSIPVAHKVSGVPKFTVLPVAALLAEAISRVAQDDSLTELHDPAKVALYYTLPQ